MKKIAFCCDAVGQALNCIALAQAATRNGYQAIIVADRTLADLVEPYAIDFHSLDIHQQEEVEAATSIWQQTVETHLDEIEASSLARIKNYIIPYYESVIAVAKKAQPQYAKAFNIIQPDLICVDDIAMLPAYQQSGCPWVRIVSCNELEITDVNCPPHLSGYEQKNTTSWEAYRQTFLQQINAPQQTYNDFLKEYNVDPYPVGCIMPPSAYLNFILYPSPIAYPRNNPLQKPQFTYLSALLRAEKHWELPQFPNPQDPLIYLSYGSMHAASPQNILAQLSSFANKSFRVIAAVGPVNNDCESPAANIFITDFLPQQQVIPHADCVIFHGGNNTCNEILYFGKPSIILPFAWDGYDNATRLNELQLGVALANKQKDWDILPKICEQLVKDHKMQQKLQKISQQLQQYPGCDTAIKTLQQCKLL